MTQIRIRYVDQFVDRHGHPRHYFRRPGGPRFRFRGCPARMNSFRPIGQRLKANNRLRAGEERARARARSIVWHSIILPALISFALGRERDTPIVL